MKVQCNKCGAQGNVDTTKIPSRGIRVSCPRCRNIFFVKKEEPPLSSSLKSKDILMPSSKSRGLIPSETIIQDADTAAQRGREFLKRNLIEEALESFQKVVELNPRHPDGYRTLGFIYGRKEMWPEALKALEKALEINPNDLQSQKNLGILHLKQGNFDNALSALEKAFELNPNDEKIRAYIKALKEKKSQLKEGSVEFWRSKGLSVRASNSLVKVSRVTL